MHVYLIDWKNYDTIYPAVQVCQNCQDTYTASNHALKAGHLSLLEHIDYTFRISGISRACSHQLVRHRMASYSQQSQRHVKLEGTEWYVVPEGVKDFKAYHSLMQIIKASYDEMINNGVPMEDARYILPNATKTELIVTMNARALDNFFKHRMCMRAQTEIRELATKMYEKIRPLNPYFMNMNYPLCSECKNPCKHYSK